MSTFLPIKKQLWYNLDEVMAVGRQARQYSQSRLYHIIYRGTNRQNIFEEEYDYIKMLEILSDLKQEMNFALYAYCLMSNHGHLLLKESNTGDISIIMKRLLTKYAGWFNRKYDRSGVLIGNRYKSQPVEDDRYLLSVVRYIHQNPLKANLVSVIGDYKWSSYHEYLNKSIVTDTQMILSMIDTRAFEDFHRAEESRSHEVRDGVRKSEDYVRQRIIQIMNGKEPFEIGILPKRERNEIIRQLRFNEGFSIRQIERATGITRGIISNVILAKGDNRN